MEPPKSILFVCTGNTCRSPMAAALMRRALDKRGRSDIIVESAGLAADGSPASGNAVAAMAEQGRGFPVGHGIHAPGQPPDLPLGPHTAPQSEKVQQLPGVHGDQHAGLRGVGQYEPGVLRREAQLPPPLISGKRLLHIRPKGGFRRRA